MGVTAVILSWRSPFRFARAMWHAWVYLWNGLPVIAPKAIIDHRVAICGKCRFKDGHFCRKCSCYIEAKACLASEECPDGRWAKCFTSRRGKT